MLADAERAAAVTVEPGMDAKYLREAIKAKQSGEAEAARLRSILFPED